MRSAFLAPVLILVLCGGLVGCSGSQQLSYNGPEDAYKKGMAEFEQGNYDRAVRFFRAVFNYGRGNEWAPDAQFQLALARAGQERYLVAANEFRRFTQLYQNDERVPRALYERARAYYNRSPMYRLDQTDTREAISLFQLFIDRYPMHDLVADAQEKIDELRAKLAHKKHAAARHYERRERWEAAVEVYEYVFDQYPDTPWADNALLGAIRSYISYADRSVQQQQADRYQQAIDHYNRLAQLFPNSDLLSQAEQLYSEAQQKLKSVRAQEGNQSLAREETSGSAK